MKNKCTCCLMVLAGAILMVGSPAYAQVQPIPSVEQLEAQFETQLSTRDEPYGRPKATSYYDDLVDHYEQCQIMSDFIDQGIR